MKKFTYTLSFSHMARTLCPEHVGNNESVWQIRGDVVEDCYTWVNAFEAFHPDYGVVKGDFESAVYASSDEAMADFLYYHPFDEWDYHDI